MSHSSLPSSLPEFATPSVGWHPRSRRVRLPGGFAHVVDTGGDGPAVVLLHGILVSSWAWRFNLDALAGRFRVIAICQRGHGWSHRRGEDWSVASLSRFVLRVLDELGVERAHLVGNSLGGAVALRLTLDHPGRVGRVLLVDPAAVPYKGLGSFLRFLHRGLGPVYRAGARPFVFRTLLRTLAYRNIPIDDHYMRWFMAPLRQPGSIAASVAILRQLQSGLRSLFDQLRAQPPSHEFQLLWGSWDRLVPVRAGEILAQVLPNSRLEVWPHVAHCAMEEDPERFNRLTMDFLTGER